MVIFLAIILALSFNCTTTAVEISSTIRGSLGVVAEGATVAEIIQSLLGKKADVPEVFIYGPWEYYNNGTPMKQILCGVQFKSEVWSGRKAEVLINGAQAGSISLGLDKGSKKYKIVSTPGIDSVNLLLPKPGTYRVEVRIPVAEGFYYSQSKIVEVGVFDFYNSALCKKKGAVSIEMRVDPLYGLTLEPGTPVTVLIPDLGLAIETVIEIGTEPWGSVYYRFGFSLQNYLYEGLSGRNVGVEVEIPGFKPRKGEVWFSERSDLKLCK